VTAVVRRDDQILLVQRADNGTWTPVTGIPDRARSRPRRPREKCSRRPG
jgi:ADP-ribose pyrophosphatase YjhB (NUDIX family)